MLRYQHRTNMCDRNTILTQSTYTHNPLAHDPPSSPTINANSIVRPNADTQAAAVVFTRRPSPVSSSIDSLTLTPLGLNNEPCRATTVVLLLHELQLRPASSFISSSDLSVPVTSSGIGLAMPAIVAAAFSGWFRGLGRRWWREQGVKLRSLDGQRSE
jgi:hypothetical protein